MKKTLLFLMCCAMVSLTFGQRVSYKKGHALGINFFLNDFKTASDIRTNGIVDALKSKDFFSLSRMSPGMGIDYIAGLNNHMDFTASLGGSFVDYPNSNITNNSNGNNSLLSELNAGLNFKLLSDRYALTPYLQVGAGASNYKNYFAAYTPVGLGLQLNIADESFLFLGSQYRIPLTDNASYHLHTSLGVAGTISKKKEPAPKAVEIPVVLDRDGDGVVDSLDRCPDVPGLAALQGCPDKDGDGIADIDDKCPDVPGIAKYQGCPIPDTDGDGINDEEDKCPNIKGVARYQGCPVPDTDGDGVNDEEDKCPTVAGPASNQGCPVIDVVVVEKVNKAAGQIFFASSSAKLLPKSFTSLKEVAKILEDNPSYKLKVDGHTDITGNAEKNQILSEERAASVKQYLVENGVEESRIVSEGHGINNPIADNKTAAGRAQNRRVEMKLSNY